MSHKSFLALFLFFLANLLEAQAPGNVTANFPLWLKANAGTSTTTDGVGVQTWTDQATALGGSNNATQATAANRPLYKSLTPINFNPYIRFDGVSDRFQIASNTSINNVASLTKSVYYAFRTGSSVISPVRQLIYKERNHQSGFNLYLYNGNLYCSAFKTNTAPTWPWKGNSVAATPNTTYVVSFIMNGTAANAGTIACYVNSSQFANLTGVGQIQAVNAISNIGSRELRTNYEGVQVANANADFSAVDFSEIAYYNAAHTTAERNKIESYLGVKYGVTLNQTVANNYTNSAGTVIFNATGTHNSYRNDIAGIMIDTNSGLSQLQSKSVNTDAIVTMSTASAMANTESLLWGNDNDDNGVIQEIYTGIPAGVAARLDRVWRADQTGDVGTVTITFNLNGIAVSGTSASQFRLLVDSVNSDFTSGATQVNAATYSGGIVTFNNVDFTGDDYFTLVTYVTPSPPTVTLTTNSSTILENGGVATLTATLSNIWTSAVTVNLSYSGTATNVTDYSRSGASITIPINSLSGSVTLTAIDDAFSEGAETVITDISSVSGGGTESGVQQVTVTITDDEPVNNACSGQERIFTTELASGDVNTYSIAGVYQATSTSAYTQNYEMIIDPDNNYRYLASYGNLRITRANFDGTGEITLFNTSLYSANPPFQVTINPNQGKIYWTDWAANTANIFCANLDGTGTPVAIATGLNYPTGMQIDKNTGRLYVYFGLNAPITLTTALTNGSCGAITLATLLNTGLDLAYNLTIDPPGNRLFFVDYNSQTIKKVNTDGTSLVTLRTLTAPGDQMRDIVYNKNTNNLYWVHTNGVIQRALADGTGGITTVVASGQPDSRSIDICVDDAAPRLSRFYSTSANSRYCPIVPINSIDIRAVYDESVVAGSTITVQLNNGANVVLSSITGNEISGTYTVGATGSGQTIADLSVASIVSESVLDVNNNTRVNSTVPASPNNLGDSSNIVVDTSAPVITEVTPVASPTINRNPTYVINSSEVATISFGGSCNSVTTSLVAGNNTITLDSNGAGGQLADGVYSNCTITVTDASACNTTNYNISAFTVAATVPTVTLSRNFATINEAAGVATFTATLINTYALATTVNLSFSGTAGGSDYSASNTQIVIPALSTTGTITVTATEDLLVESTETVIVDISTVTNGTESGVQQASTSILDNDSPSSVTLSTNLSSISEAGGVAILTATLNTLSALNVTANLTYTGTAANGTDYTAATSIVITAGSLSASINLTGLEDATFEVTETAIVDISSVTNGTEAGVQQVTVSITEDAVCNQPAWPAPHGLTKYIAMSFERTFASTNGYVPPSGDAFDTYLARNQTQKDAKRDSAYAFFLSEYGLDFANDGISCPGGICIMNGPDAQVMLRYISFDSNFQAKINAASSYKVDTSGGDLRAGIYQVLTFDTENMSGNDGTILNGAWGGGPGKLVPRGTVLEYGEYQLQILYPCTDAPNPNFTRTDTFLVEFQSQKPSLADFNEDNGAFFLDIPQIFEYEITNVTPNFPTGFVNGEIIGRTEIRQDPASPYNVTAISSVTLTVP